VWSNSTVEMMSAACELVPAGYKGSGLNLDGNGHAPSVISSTSPLSPKHWAKRHCEDESVSILTRLGGGDQRVKLKDEVGKAGRREGDRGRLVGRRRLVGWLGTDERGRGGDRRDRVQRMQ